MMTLIWTLTTGRSYRQRFADRANLQAAIDRLPVGAIWTIQTERS